jgi:hypothetical protein
MALQPVFKMSPDIIDIVDNIAVIAPQRDDNKIFSLAVAKLSISGENIARYR